MLTCVQAEGDQLDGKIQKAEKEIRALENTLSKLNAKNQNLRQSFHNPDTTRFLTKPLTNLSCC